MSVTELNTLKLRHRYRVDISDSHTNTFSDFNWQWYSEHETTRAAAIDGAKKALEDFDRLHPKMTLASMTVKVAEVRKGKVLSGYMESFRLYRPEITSAELPTLPVSDEEIADELIFKAREKGYRALVLVAKITIFVSILICFSGYFWLPFPDNSNAMERNIMGVVMLLVGIALTFIMKEDLRSILIFLVGLARKHSIIKK